MNALKGLFSRMKTKRSPLDVSDFVAKRTAPSVSAIWERIDARYMGTKEQDAKSLELHKKRMFFDVKYRCGAEGRCLEGDYRCRFPSCFNMRPCVKGGEIFVERVGLADKVSSFNHDVSVLLEKEELHQAIAKLTERLTDMEAKQDLKSMTATSLTNFVDLAMLRASVLVNVGKDEEAVDFLLALANRCPRPERIECTVMAANWAALNDMEVRFFRMHAVEFPNLEGAKEKAEKPQLLQRVVEQVKADEEIEDHVVHAVLGKEVSTIVARAQNAQDYEDMAEDPMGTSVVKDSVDHYKDEIGGRFWDKFFHLMMMPPLNPKDNPVNAPPEETPRNVLDALGRSMLLHHTAKALGVEAERDEQSGVENLNKISLEELEALPRQQRIALKRMQELLSVVRKHATAGQPTLPKAK